MLAVNRNVAIRFNPQGGETVIRELKHIGDSGEEAARRYGAAMQRAANDVEGAMRRQEMARRKLAVLSGGDIAVPPAANFQAMIRAQNDAAKAANAHRAAMTGLSYQAQDTFTQLSMGANPLQVIAIQGAQAAGQMANMGGKLGAVASVLAGPWGLAVSGGLMLVAALSNRFSEAADAAEGKKKAVLSLSEAIDQLRESTGRQIKSERQLQDETLRSAQAMRQKALDTRAATMEALRSTRARLTEEIGRAGSWWGGEINAGSIAAGGLEGRLRQLDGQLARQERDLAKATLTFRQAEIPIMQRQVAEAVDRSAAATGRYERAIDKLNERYRAGKMSASQYEAESLALARTRDREKEAAEKAERASRGKGAADREAAKAAREAAAAQRELAGDLSSIVGALDPARAAADRYSETLAKLGKLRAAGQLTHGEAVLYGAQAGWAERDRQSSEFNRNSALMLGLAREDPMESILAERGREAEAWKRANEEREKFNQQLFDRQRHQVGEVADLYHTLFTQGTKGVWDRFRDMGLSVISELLARWTLFGSSGKGGLLGAVGKVLGAGTSLPAGGLPAMSASAALGAVSVPSFAVGTPYFSGGAALVGELGPELVTLPRGSRVDTARETRRILANDNAGMTLHVDASIHAPGADSAALARVEAAQEALVAALPATILAVQRDAQARRIGRVWR